MEGGDHKTTANLDKTVASKNEPKAGSLQGCKQEDDWKVFDQYGCPGSLAGVWAGGNLRIEYQGRVPVPLVNNLF